MAAGGFVNSGNGFNAMHRECVHCETNMNADSAPPQNLSNSGPELFHTRGTEVVALNYVIYFFSRHSKKRGVALVVVTADYRVILRYTVAILPERYSNLG